MRRRRRLASGTPPINAVSSRQRCTTSRRKDRGRCAIEQTGTSTCDTPEAATAVSGRSGDHGFRCCSGGLLGLAYGTGCVQCDASPARIVAMTRCHDANGPAPAAPLEEADVEPWLRLVDRLDATLASAGGQEAQRIFRAFGPRRRADAHRRLVRERQRLVLERASACASLRADSCHPLAHRAKARWTRITTSLPKHLRGAPQSRTALGLSLIHI